MSWSQKDLDNLKSKGLKVDDSKKGDIATIKPKVAKTSIEKITIDLVLWNIRKENYFDDYVTELIFDDFRKFRFDWAIPSKKITIEYEGIFSNKSRHTTKSGFSEDCIKYNLATAQGWRVLRYTAKNYKNLETDLLKLL